MSGKYTEEELAGLSETERAALTATDDEDNSILAGIAGEDDDEGDGTDDGTDSDDGDDGDDGATGDGTDGGGTDDDQGDQGADGDADDGTADDGDQDLATDVGLEDIPPVTFVPKLSGEILPQYQTAINEFATSKQPEIDALDAKLDEGEITLAEHRNQVRAIENSIRAETRKLEAFSQNTEIGSQLWQAEQEAFFKANASFKEKENPVLWGALNQEVMRLAKDPANAHLSGIQTLYAAKRNVEKAFMAITGAKPGSNTNDTGKDKDKGKGKQIPSKPSAKRPDHQTLRDVPSADAADVGQDKFAHLDKLSGTQLEAAIAKMSPEEQDEYLRGA